MPEQGFPNSPAVNDTTILNGMTYKFNGSAWDKVAGAVSTEIPFATQVDLDAAVAVSTTQTGDIAGLTTAMGTKAEADMTNVGTLPASVVAQLKGDIGNTGAAGSNGSDGSFDGTLKTINGENLTGSGDITAGGGFANQITVRSYGRGNHSGPQATAQSATFTPTGTTIMVTGTGGGGSGRGGVTVSVASGGGGGAAVKSLVIAVTAGVPISIVSGRGGAQSGGSANGKAGDPATITQGGSLLLSLGAGAGGVYGSAAGGTVTGTQVPSHSIGVFNGNSGRTGQSARNKSPGLGYFVTVSNIDNSFEGGNTDGSGSANADASGAQPGYDGFLQILY